MSQPPNGISISLAIFAYTTAGYWCLTSLNIAETISKYTQCFSMGRTTPKIVHSPWISGPHQIYGSLGPLGSAPNWHLYWLSRSCRAHERDQQTDTMTHKHTDRPHYFVGRTSRILCTECMRRDLKSDGWIFMKFGNMQIMDQRRELITLNDLEHIPDILSQLVWW